MPTPMWHTDSPLRASWDSDPRTSWTLWRILMKGPSGLPLTVELRAPNEAMALERATYYKPYHTVAQDAYGNPLVERRPTP